jgi:RNA polymerase sigma-70 factor, ECF subfamily
VSAAAGLDLPAETTEASLPSGLGSTSNARASGALLPFGSAFQQAYNEHFALVWRGLLRLGTPRPALEDAAQDVFLVVHRRAADFAGTSAFRTWLYGIVLKVAKDYRRSDARHRRRVQRFADWAQAESFAAPSPALEAEQREAARLVQMVLDRMNDEQREVLVLVELEQLPLREAAEALGLQLRTCQRRLSAARESFDILLGRISEPHPQDPKGRPGSGSTTP